MSFDQLLKRYFFLILLGLVALVAYFQASGTMYLVGAAMSKPLGSAALDLVVGAAPRITRPSPKSAKIILSRNVFDSVTGPIDSESKPALDASRGASGDFSDPLGVSTCEGFRAFIVTETTSPLWSMAALQGPGETAPKLRRVGDEVAGKLVAYIGYNGRSQSPAIWLESGVTLCQVLLFAGAAPQAAASEPAAAATGPYSAAGAPGVGPSSPRPPKATDDIVSRVQKVSDREFRVDRSVVEKILSNQSELMKAARVMPETLNGKVLGLRLIGVRPETLLGVLGIQNGDRLETVNGYDMASPEKALEVSIRLRGADRVRVQITRAGQPMTLEYKIN